MKINLRQSLLGSAATGALILAAAAVPQTARAANECGAIPAGPNSTVNCTSLIITNGIEYVPAAGNEVFTLNIGDGTIGGATSSSAPPAGALNLGQSAATIATVATGLGAIATGPIPTGGVPATSIMNINQFSQLTGSSIGAIVWTTGAGNNSTINNSGTVLSLGTGNLSLGHGLLAVSNGGDATVVNNATGVVNAVNSGMFAYSLSGTSTVIATNNGEINAQNRDGISTIDPLLGVLPTAGAATATNNALINAGRNGVNVTSAGLATINLTATSVINASTVTNGAGAYALSVGGNADINGNAASVTNSATGAGVVGISIGGTAEVDAGVVNSGVGAVTIGGFALPAVPGLPTISGGVIALASGDATARAHGNIDTSNASGAGNFGMLALSLTGNATTISDAGITIDPPIGMSSVVIGAGTATVTNNATVNTTQVGLLGVNIGAGEILIQNSQTGIVNATAGGGVLALKTGPGSAAPLFPGNGDYSVVVSNDNANGGAGGAINASTSFGVGVIVVPVGAGPASNVLVANTNNASITSAGSGGLLDLLGATVSVGTNGNVDIVNDLNSTMTNAVGNAGLAQIVLAGGNIRSFNDRGSDITGTLDLVSLGGGVTFTNDRQSEWTSSGINAFVAFNGDATINNDNVSDINILTAGGISANLMFASNDVIINNRNNSDIDFGTIAGAAFNVMGAGRDVIINNESGADFNMLDILGANFNVMFADRNVTINNNTGASFNMVSVLGVAANVMVADEDATINNNNASFTLAGIIGANGNFMLGGDNATINNENGATFNLLGLNGNFMAAVNDVTINNESGAEFNLLGINALGFASANGATTFNNDSTVNVGTLLGIVGFATFNGLDNFNNQNGLLDERNGISDYLAVADDAVYGNGVGDRTVFTGNANFNGGGTSSFGIDAFLRGGGADSSSDQLWVGENDAGNVTGATALLVNDLNPGAGAYNPTGIRFAHVEGDAPEGSFFLPGGPIDKGFFSYDILRVETASSDWLLVSAPNDRADELAAIITGTQTLWYESSGVWLDRTADLRRQIGTCAPADEAAMSANVGGTQVTATADVAPECFYKRYGLWFRGFGGQYDRNEGVEYDQDIWGAEGGFDVVVDDDPSDGAVILGILGGYIGSKMNFDSTDDEAKFEGGSVGAYATYLYGGWFADLLFKANILDIDYDTNFDDPENDASTDALSLGVRLDTGYRFDTDGGFFIEPQGTIAYVHTEIDDYELLNTDVDPQDGESVRGRLGLRLGGSWDSGNMIFEPFLVGSVWHEFEGDNEVDLTSGASVTVSDELNSTWGEVGGGLNVFNADQSMSFFAKVDAQVGGDIESWSGKVGGRIAW